MKKLILFTLPCLLSLAGIPQTWSLQTSGTTQNLYGVSFADVNNGLAVGAQGTVLRTSNGGQTWTPINLRDNTDYQDVYMDQSNGIPRAWIAGDNGTIKYSEGDLTIWTQQNTGSTAIINDVAVEVFGDIGYAVGENGTVLRTIDAGETWVKLTNFPTNEWLTSVEMLLQNPDMLIIVGDMGTVITSNDGGETWNIINVGTSNYMTDAVFTSPTSGWLSSSPSTLYQFNNGNYTPFNLPTSNGILGLTFEGPNYGLGVGDFGYVVQWDGLSWTQQPSPTTQFLNRLDSHAEADTVDYPSNFTVHAWAVGMNGTIISTEQYVVSGIDNPIKQNRGLQIFPNPVQRTCVVSGTEPGQPYLIEIRNATGAVQKVISGIGGNGLNLEELSSGIYFVSIRTQDHMYHQKLIKE